MTLLIALCAPSEQPQPFSLRYAVTQDGLSIAQQGLATLATLPRGMGETVLILPALVLSWHAVKLPHLPRGTSLARLRSVLDGLLEEHLLDDSAHVHVALQPGRHVNQPSGHAVWVACCDKRWLLQQLQLFEQQGLPVSRLIPQTWPNASDQATTALLAGSPERPMLHVCSATGVWTLPVFNQTAFEVAIDLVIGLSPNAPAAAIKPTETYEHSVLIPEPDASEGRSALNSAASAQTPLDLRCKPALTAQAERWLGRAIPLLSQEEAWLRAYACDYDLAQFDIRLGGSSHTIRRWKKRMLQLWQAPEWRLARWGLLLALGVQLCGLNAWAWNLQQQAHVLRTQNEQILRSSFPEIKVLIDAPRQMARQADQLRQAAGDLAPHDLESLLTALATVLPAGSQLQQLTYESKQLEFQMQPSSPIDEEQVRELTERLQGLGLALVAPATEGPYTLTLLEQP